jgi:hypothetical protein
MSVGESLNEIIDRVLYWNGKGTENIKVYSTKAI